MKTSHRIASGTGLVLLLAGGTCAAAAATATAATPQSHPHLTGADTAGAVLTIDNGTNHTLTLDPSNDHEFGINGIPKTIPTGATRVPYTVTLNGSGWLDTSDHVIANYSDGSGATYEIVITVGAPQAQGSGMSQTLAFAGFKNGHAVTSLNGIYDIDLQRFIMPGAIFFQW